MSDEIVVLRVFDNEVEAQMTQQMLRDAGVATFIFKDDGGGMEPHLQRTNGVRLVLKVMMRSGPRNTAGIGECISVGRYGFDSSLLGQKSLEQDDGKGTAIRSPWSIRPASSSCGNTGNR